MAIPASFPTSFVVLEEFGTILCVHVDPTQGHCKYIVVSHLSMASQLD